MPQQITRVKLYYDSLGRVIEDAQEFDGDTRSATNEQFTSYPVTQQAFPDGRQISQQHDPLYRRTLVEETSGGADIAAWDYFGPTRVAEVTLANGLVCSHLNNDRTHSAVQESIPNPAWGDQSSDRLGYDGAGRMITKRHLAGGINGTTGAYNDPTAVVGQTTAYDKASNKYYERALQAESRSSLYEPFDADNRPAGGYDSLDRLRQYQRGVLSSNGGCGNAGGASVTTTISLPGTDENRDYDLDGLGNWRKTTFEPVGGSEETQIRQHNSLNQITSLKDEGEPKDDLSYDLNGNLLDDGTRTYQWDALNRLKVVHRKSDGEAIGEYIYDALGRRVQKTVKDGGLSGNIPDDVTRYLYHSGIAQCCEERVGTPVTKQYIWGRYIDELIQQKQSVTINGNVAGDYYPLSDTLYRTVALTNSSASIVEAYDCDAYGNTLIFTAAGTGGDWWADDATVGDNPMCGFIFTGRRYDAETESYFYRGRYYLPPFARFASRDPIGYRGGRNLYCYVRSAPLIFLDAFGRKPEKTMNGQGQWNGLSITIGTIKYPPKGWIPASESEAGHWDKLDKYIVDRDIFDDYFDVISTSAAQFVAGIKAVVDDCKAGGGTASQCCIRKIRVSGHASSGIGGQESFKQLTGADIKQLAGLMCQDKDTHIKNLQCFGFNVVHPEEERPHEDPDPTFFGKGPFAFGEMLWRSGGGKYTAYPGKTYGVIESLIDDPHFLPDEPRPNKQIEIRPGMKTIGTMHEMQSQMGHAAQLFLDANPDFGARGQ